MSDRRLPEWARRLPQATIRRLYELDAQGIYADESSTPGTRQELETWRATMNRTAETWNDPRLRVG